MLWSAGAAISRPKPKGEVPTAPWLAPGVVPLAAAWIAAIAAGQDVTRIDPVIEFRQKMPAEIDADEPFPVEIFVRNTGKAAAEAVVVTDVMGPTSTFVDADPSPAKGDGHLSWALGTIPAGAEQVIKLRLKAAATADPKFLHTIEVVYQGRGQNAREGTVRQAAPDCIAPTEPVPSARRSRSGSRSPTRATRRAGGRPPVDLPETLHHRAGHDLENPLGVIEAGQSRTLNLTVTPKQVGDFSAQLRAGRQVGQDGRGDGPREGDAGPVEPGR